MTDEKKDGGLSAVLKWAPLLLSFVTTVSTLTVLVIEKPGAFKSAAVSIAAVGATVLWLMLWQVYRSKRSARHDPSKKHYKHSKRQRAAALAGLIILPTLACVVAYIESKPPPLRPPPPDKLAVAIAGFTPESPALADTALHIVETLQSMLNDMKSNDPDLRLKSDPFSEQQIHSRSDSAQDDARAIRFGQLHGAHLVIWGQVVRSGGQLLMKPTISTAYKWTAETEPGAKEAANFGRVPIAQVFKPTDDKGLDEQIETLARLLVGAAYQRAKNWEKAIYFLTSESDEATLLSLGDTFFRQAQEVKADNRRIALDNAVATLDKLIGKLADDSDGMELMSAVAQFLLGESCRERASFDQESAYLGRAKNAYRQSELEYSRVGADKTPWQLENNLGVVFYKLAALGDGAVEYLRQANAVYSVGLGILGENPDGTIPSGGCAAVPAGPPAEDERVRNVAQVFGNRGSARFEWGLQMRSSNGFGRDHLDCAKSDFEKALTLLTSLASRNRKSEAEIEGNLGNVFAELAEEKPEEADKLREKAIKYYGDALNAGAPGDLQYTQVQKARAQTYYDQGIRSKQQGPLNLAVFEYVEVIRELRTTKSNGDLADALYCQARAKRALFHIQGCDLVCLQGAIAALQESEALFHQLGKLQQQQEVHAELVRAQGDAHHQ